MRRAWVVGLAALALGCAEDAGPQAFPFRFVARADELPLGGVRVSAEGVELGGTDAAGVLEATLTGSTGQQVSLGVECPSGFVAAEEPPRVTLQPLRRLEEGTGARSVQIRLACRPLERRGVLLVLAGEEDLPVEVDGREVARTDADGLAHVELGLAPQTSFEVVLRTEHAADLSPRNPPRSFTMPDADEVFVFEQSFSRIATEPEPTSPRPRARAVQRLPQRIPSGARR